MPLLHSRDFTMRLCDISGSPEIQYFLLCFVLQAASNKQTTQSKNSFIKMVCLFIPQTGFQPLLVRQCSDAGQRLLQEAGGQEVAQHGQPQLYEEIHQAMERRVVHARHHPKGLNLQFLLNIFKWNRTLLSLYKWK